MPLCCRELLSVCPIYLPSLNLGLFALIQLSPVEHSSDVLTARSKIEINQPYLSYHHIPSISSPCLPSLPTIPKSDASSLTRGPTPTALIFIPSHTLKPLPMNRPGLCSRTTATTRKKSLPFSPSPCRPLHSAHRLKTLRRDNQHQRGPTLFCSS